MPEVSEVGFEQSGLGILGDGCRRPAPPEEFLVEVPDDASEEILLVLEVPVQASERESGLFCDIAHAGVDVAGSGEDLRRCVEDPLSCSLTFRSCRFSGHRYLRGWMASVRCEARDWSPCRWSTCGSCRVWRPAANDPPGATVGPSINRSDVSAFIIPAGLQYCGK